MGCSWLHLLPPPPATASAGPVIRHKRRSWRERERVDGREEPQTEHPLTIRMSLEEDSQSTWRRPHEETGRRCKLHSERFLALKRIPWPSYPSDARIETSLEGNIVKNGFLNWNMGQTKSKGSQLQSRNLAFWQVEAPPPPPSLPPPSCDATFSTHSIPSPTPLTHK